MFTSVKLAHLILTHANPEHLLRLVNALHHPDAHFYIHLDKKTDIADYLPIANIPNVFFIKHRIKVYWGGYSIVQATVNSFEEILNAPHAYAYINLLSGQDYPIKSPEYIHRFLAKNPGKIFMHFLSLTDEWHEAIPRITQYHLANYNLPMGTYSIERVINHLLPVRKLPEGIVAVGRSQWFTATPESIRYMVNYINEKPWISRFFKLTWAPDEIIFQTILYNSPFREQMVNDNLLYVDWSAGGASPKTLNMNDAEALRDSDKLFARKFNVNTDQKILNYLDKIITGPAHS